MPEPGYWGDLSGLTPELRRIIEREEPKRLDQVDDPIGLLLHAIAGRALGNESDPKHQETGTHIQTWIGVRSWKRSGSQGTKPHDPSDTPSDGWTQDTLAVAQRYNDTIKRVMEQAQRELKAWREREDQTDHADDN